MWFISPEPYLYSVSERTLSPTLPLKNNERYSRSCDLYVSGLLILQFLGLCVLCRGAHKGDGFSYTADSIVLEVPEDIPRHVFSLTVHSNMLTSLKENQFKSFIWLQHLDLSLGNVQDIELGSFTGLTSLKSLSLWKNKVSDISSGTWQGLYSLKILDFRYNFVESVNFDVWMMLPKLEELYLDHNAISVIGDGAFHSLLNLRVLHLHNNELKTLDISALVLPKASGSQIIRLTLSHNPLEEDNVICKAIVAEVDKSEHLQWAEEARSRVGLEPEEDTWSAAPHCTEPGEYTVKYVRGNVRAYLMCWAQERYKKWIWADVRQAESESQRKVSGALRFAALGQTTESARLVCSLFTGHPANFPNPLHSTNYVFRVASYVHLDFSTGCRVVSSSSYAWIHSAFDAP